LTALPGAALVPRSAVRDSILRISAGDYLRLQRHLLRSDGDEHAAVALCGHAELPTRDLLLVREIHLVADEDFPYGVNGYRQITPRAVAELSGLAAERGLSYVSLHSHPLARARNRLSADDLAAHDRLFPHLYDITGGRPVAGVALGQASVAGEVWRSRTG